MNADGLACLTAEMSSHFVQALLTHKGGLLWTSLGTSAWDGTGWGGVPLQEDGAVSDEEDGLVQAAAQAAEPRGGQVGDFHGHGSSLRLVDPSVAKERSEWSESGC